MGQEDCTLRPRRKFSDEFTRDAVEMRSVVSASSALRELAAMVPDVAHLIDGDGSITDVAVSSLEIGQRFVVRPGEQVPIDGDVVEGRSLMNEAFLAGESRPVSWQPDSEIVSGAINGEGALTVAVTRTGDDTTLPQNTRLVAAVGRSEERPVSGEWSSVVEVETGDQVGERLDGSLTVLIPVLLVADRQVVRVARPIQANR